MVTNSTMETLNYAKDLDIEYNIKFILLTMILVYSIVLLLWAYKWEADELYKQIVKIFAMQIPSVIFIFFTPLTMIYLFRGISWEVIYGFLIAYYTYLFVVFLLAGKLGLFTMLGNLIGIDTTIKKMEMKNK